MIRTPKTAFALALLAPLLWSLVTSPPIEAQADGRDVDGLIPMFIVDTNGNGRPDQVPAVVAPGIDRSIGLTFDPVTNRAGWMTPWDGCRPGPDPWQTEFGDFTAMGTLGMRATTAKRTNTVTGEAYDIATARDPVDHTIMAITGERTKFGGGAPAGDGAVEFHKNEAGVGTGFTFQARDEFGVPFGVDVEYVTHFTPFTEDGSWYQSMPWAAVVGLGHGIANTTNPCKVAMGSASQVFVNISDTDGDGTPDSPVWRTIDGTPIDIFPPFSPSADKKTKAELTITKKGTGNGTVSCRHGDITGSVDCGTGCATLTTMAGPTKTISCDPRADVFSDFTSGSQWTCDNPNFLIDPRTLGDQLQLNLQGPTTCMVTFNPKGTPNPNPDPNPGGGPSNFSAQALGGNRVVFSWDGVANEIRYHDVNAGGLASPYPGGPVLNAAAGMPSTAPASNPWTFLIPEQYRAFAASRGTPPGTWWFAALGPGGLSNAVQSHTGP